MKSQPSALSDELSTRSGASVRPTRQRDHGSFTRRALVALNILCVGLLGCSDELEGESRSSGSGGMSTTTGTGGVGIDAGNGGSIPGAGGLAANTGGVAAESGKITPAAGGAGTGGTVIFPEPEKPQWTVETLAELREAIQQSEETVVMREGDYNLTDLPENSRNLNFSGSNNTVDLVGVYIEVPVGSTARASYLTMEGSGNTLIGGIIEDTYADGLVDVTDYYAYNKDSSLSYGLGGDAVFNVSGSDNLIDGIKLTVRGSFPYGYGMIYGIGSGNEFGLSKRCGIVIKGQNNVIDHVELQQRAFCHGIYMQSPADNTTIRNSLVQGVMRPAAELYTETESDSLPSQRNFTVPQPLGRPVTDGTPAAPIPMDEYYTLSEDGIRVYTDGGSATVENCTVIGMRGGIRLYSASVATITDSTALDCEMTNFNLPAGGSMTGSTGNFTYGPLNDNRLSRSRQDIEVTILPSPGATGAHNIADVLGNNQNIVFHRASGPEDTGVTRAIVVAGNNSTILNETEYRIVVNGDGNDITSAGQVTDNGSNNDVTAIPLSL